MKETSLNLRSKMSKNVRVIKSIQTASRTQVLSAVIFGTKFTYLDYPFLKSIAVIFKTWPLQNKFVERKC